MTDQSTERLADRIAGDLSPFSFVSKDERDLIVSALRALRREEPAGKVRFWDHRDFKRKQTAASQGETTRTHGELAPLAPQQEATRNALAQTLLDEDYQLLDSMGLADLVMRGFDVRSKVAAQGEAGEDEIWTNVKANVREQLGEGDGMWATCSGCHESEDGYSSGHYQHSAVFGCKLGSGCSECGGIGAIWDTTDYGAMANELVAEMYATSPATSRPAAQPMRAALEQIVARTYSSDRRCRLDYESVAEICDIARAALAPTSANEVKHD